MEDLYAKIERFYGKYGITEANPESKEYFSAIVKIALEEFKIPVTDITRKFGASIPTVERWSSGKSAPHPAMRKVAIEEILKLL